MPLSKKKKGRRKRKKKREADIEKESKYTHSKDIERTKKRGTDRESNIKQRRNTQHRFVYEISPVPFFSISLSLSLSFSNNNFCLVMQIGLGFMGSS